jgi:hypothetical protein
MRFPRSHGWALAGTVFGGLILLVAVLRGYGAKEVRTPLLVMERLLRPGRQRPFPSWPAAGLLPALVYLMLAVAWVHHIGPWEGFAK